VAEGSSQHDKCQVGNMLWTEGSSQPERCQVWNMQSNSLDLVHFGIYLSFFIIRPSRAVRGSRLFWHRSDCDCH
jgi:hypothetical protein